MAEVEGILEEVRRMSIWHITSGWDVITAIATAIVALGIGLAFRQLRGDVKARRLQAFNSLLDIWGGVQEREARGYVFRDFKFDDLADLRDERRKSELAKVELTLAICNRISFMALEKLVTEKAVRELVGDPMVRCWDKLQDFVEARRDEFKEEKLKKLYMCQFEEFVKRNRAKVYMTKK